MWQRIGKWLVFVGVLPPDAVLGLGAKLIELDGHIFIVCPHTVKNVAVIRSRGMSAPSAAEQYNYATAPFTPMKHQLATVAHFVDNPRCYCANGLGTGKTLAALWAAEFLLEQKEVRRVLIVAPKTILQKVWGFEFFRTTPHRRFWVARGDRRNKIKSVADDSITYVAINPESLHIVEKELIRCAFDLIIVDESTKFKVANTRCNKSLTRISIGRRLWLMSGTPTPQSPLDAHGQIKLLRGGNYMSLSKFRDITMTKVREFKWLPKDTAVGFIAKELTPVIRFHRDECAELPPIQYINYDVEISTEQEQAIRTFNKHAVATVAGQEITAMNAAVVFSKVLQVMAGGVYYDDPEDKNSRAVATVDASGLLDTISDIVDEAASPVLVFTNFRSSVALIKERLEKEGKRVAAITSDVTMDERTAIFNKVQAGELDAMVAIPRTVAHGLTLTRSNTIVWAVPPLSQEVYEQANARIYRTGQKNKCVVYQLCVNKVAHELFKRLEDKTALQDILLNLVKEYS